MVDYTQIYDMPDYTQLVRHARIYTKRYMSDYTQFVRHARLYRDSEKSEIINR